MKNLLFVLLGLIIVTSNAFSTGLVAHYEFDNNVVDLSGTGNNGLFYNEAYGTDRFGNANSAGYFNGINAWMEVQSPKGLDLTSWTISGWINISSITSNENGDPLETTIIGKLNNSAGLYNYAVELRNDMRLTSQYESEFSIEPDFDHFVGYATIELNEWIFFTSIRNELDGRHALYINGNLFDEGFWFDDIPVTTPDPLYTARIASGGENYYHGLMDDMRIYNGALSDDEIMGLYTIPEPTTFLFLASGLLGLIGIQTARRRKNK
ncbi:hypothetical protein JW960_06550 [candidate division KSB1 bacterium]|nr:hypothetical protein [candidate division KSB1 bacterium]